MNNAQTHVQASLARRHRRERRFRAYGIAALTFASAMLIYLLWSIVTPGISGFVRHELALPMPAHAPATLEASYAQMKTAVRESVAKAPQSNVEKRQLLSLVGTFAAHEWQAQTAAHAACTAKHHNNTACGDVIRIPLGDNADQLLKGNIDASLPAHVRPINDKQIAWLTEWQEAGRVHAAFNIGFFTGGDSRAPEGAGVGGALVGSLFTLLMCMLAAFPIAVAAAIYLEEFAPKNRFTELLELCINNLAAVPSIIYGLLGLSVLLNVFGLPRSSPLVGGFTLALLVLPVMIIATRASLRAVPPSMRLAATALGASRLQVVWSHVLPYALPGMMTGAILGMARAIGETAPLLMIGMVAFVADVPRTMLDAATAMPVQIYLWASSPELGFVEKTSTAIIVLLAVLLLLNTTAIYIRRKFEITW